MRVVVVVHGLVCLHDLSTRCLSKALNLRTVGYLSQSCLPFFPFTHQLLKGNLQVVLVAELTTSTWLRCQAAPSPRASVRTRTRWISPKSAGACSDAQCGHGRRNIRTTRRIVALSLCDKHALVPVMVAC